MNSPKLLHLLTLLFLLALSQRGIFGLHRDQTDRGAFHDIGAFPPAGQGRQVVGGDTGERVGRIGLGLAETKAFPFQQHDAVAQHSGIGQAGPQAVRDGSEVFADNQAFGAMALQCHLGEQVFQRIAGHQGWTIRRLDLRRRKLEDHFVEVVLREEPALAPHVAGGLLYPDGLRTDPGALTAAAAAAATAAGAGIHTHVEVKRVGRARVVTDDGTHHAAVVLVCAGAWTRALAHPLGHDVQVRPVRGWLAVTAPGPALLRHVIYESGYTEPSGPQPGAAVTLADLAADGLARNQPQMHAD